MTVQRSSIYKTNAFETFTGSNTHYQPRSLFISSMPTTAIIMVFSERISAPILSAAWCTTASFHLSKNDSLVAQK